MENGKDIVVVIDESGSMIDMGDEPKESINLFIEEQRDANVLGSRYSLYKFNTKVTEICVDKKLEEFVSFDNYKPGGMTALYDAMGKAITNKDKSEDVVFLIITDGKDNSSIEYNKESIRILVKKMEEEYKWKFIFMGANQDSYAEGGNIGITNCYDFKPEAYKSLDDNIPGMIKLVRSISSDISAERSNTL